MERRKDSVVESVRDDLLQRSRVGIKKYNVTLDREDLSLVDWLQHAYEECLDQANYLKKSILILKNQKITMEATNLEKLAQKLAHNSVLETITRHNTLYPDNLKEIYEEIDEITPEHKELQYGPFAQAIYDERLEYYSNEITNG